MHTKFFSHGNTEYTEIRHLIKRSSLRGTKQSYCAMPKVIPQDVELLNKLNILRYYEATCPGPLEVITTQPTRNIHAFPAEK